VHDDDDVVVVAVAHDGDGVPVDAGADDRHDDHLALTR